VELRTERRSVTDNDGRTVSVPIAVFHGYALKYGKLSQNLGGFVEQVAGRSTIAKTLADGGDVVARMHHKDEYLLGRTSAGTLRLNPDDIGLPYDVESPGTSYANDLEKLARRGDIKHSSFAFRTVGEGGDDWSLTDSGFPLRTLVEIQLVDVAPVVQPAYTDTSSSVRSLAAHLDADPEEIAELLRSGEIRKALKPPAVNIDLGGIAAAEALIPKSSVRRFDPGQPRDGDGKWSDGPGGGGGGSPLSALTGDDEDDDDKPARKFTADATYRTRHDKIGIARDGDGVELKLDGVEEPVFVKLTERDLDQLEQHLDATDAMLDQRAAMADRWHEKVFNSDAQQAKERRREELKRQKKAELAATGKAPGSPERIAIQEKYDALVEAEIGAQPENPFDSGELIVQATGRFGDLHIGASLSDTGPHYYISDQPVTEDDIGVSTVELSPRQARSLLTKMRATSTQRALPTTTETRPDALHLATAARARQLDLLARRFPL
jgi:HK97 family phage prohead protease